ncbi:MAG: hypothetical protein AAGM22_24325 [Acidobacteriota bacterium]
MEGPIKGFAMRVAHGHGDPVDLEICFFEQIFGSADSASFNVLAQPDAHSRPESSREIIIRNAAPPAHGADVQLRVKESTVDELDDLLDIAGRFIVRFFKLREISLQDRLAHLSFR